MIALSGGLSIAFMCGGLALDRKQIELINRCMGRDPGLDQIVESMEAAEKQTSAEFVVALEPQSGSYRDIDVTFAAGSNFLFLLLAIFAPVTIDQQWFPLYQVILFGLAWAFSAHTSYVRRVFCSGERFERQAIEKAWLLFHDQGVSQTRGRTGIMVLVSQLEKKVVVAADSGVMRAVEADAWKAVTAKTQMTYDGEDLSATAAKAVQELGDFLTESLPVSEDDIDELSNVPTLH
jgi:putative membrane protein